VGHGVGCGHSGAGPHLLYQALVHAVDGSVASATEAGSSTSPARSTAGWPASGKPATKPCTLLPLTGPGE